MTIKTTSADRAGTKAALLRSAQFLRAPAEKPGQRALHHLHLASCIEKAMGHAILAGQDQIALKLSALRNEANAAFGAELMAAEGDYLDADLAECDRRLAEIEAAKAASATKPSRRLKASGSPGDRDRRRARKRGATFITL